MTQDELTFVCGPHGSGKSFLCNMLVQTDPSLIHLECGPTIRSIHAQSDSGLTLHQWIIEQNALHGEHYVESLVRKVFLRCIQENRDARRVLISGARSMQHIAFLSEPWQLRFPQIVYLECDIGVLKKNYEHREGKIVSEELFFQLLAHDQEMGLEAVKSHVRHHEDARMFIHNNMNNLEGVLEQLRQIVYR